MNGASTRKSLDSRLRGNDGAWSWQTGIGHFADHRHSHAGGNPVTLRPGYIGAGARPHLKEEAHGHGQAARRLSARKRPQRHCVSRRHIEPGAACLAASDVCGGRLQRPLRRPSPGLVRSARHDGVCDRSREADQEMAASVEGGSDRVCESVPARSVERDHWIAGGDHRRCWKALNSRLRGNDALLAVEVCGRLDVDCRHSREGGNPVSWTSGPQVGEEFSCLPLLVRIAPPR